MDGNNSLPSPGIFSEHIELVVESIATACHWAYWTVFRGRTRFYHCHRLNLLHVIIYRDRLFRLQSLRHPWQFVISRPHLTFCTNVASLIGILSLKTFSASIMTKVRVAACHGLRSFSNLFLDATMQLHKRSCPFVRRSVCPMLFSNKRHFQWRYSTWTWLVCASYKLLPISFQVSGWSSL